jgi:hypothetical protein
VGISSVALVAALVVICFGVIFSIFGRSTTLFIIYHSICRGLELLFNGQILVTFGLQAMSSSSGQDESRETSSSISATHLAIFTQELQDLLTDKELLPLFEQLLKAFNAQNLLFFIQEVRTN